MFWDKVKKILTYENYEPVIYRESLKEAYSSKSVAGGTLRGRTVLITGASGDIGRALSVRYIDEGCNIILAGRSEKKLDDTISYIYTKRTEFNYSKLVFDMTDKQSILNAVQRLKKQNQSIDVLICNAGFFSGDDRNGVFRKYQVDNFMTSWRTNYIGVCYLCEEMAEYMSNNTSESKIILISSICAIQKKAQYTPYGMSKAASTEFVRSLRTIYPGISMNIIFPGSVATKMGNIKTGDNIAKKSNKLNRVILPEEIASLAAFLSSDVGYYVKDGIIAAACEML